MKRPLSLKGKLVLAVSGLVIGSGLLISLLVTQRYSRSLLEAVTDQGENLAHTVALEATDKILINDLIALQKMLDHQMGSNPSLAYLFIVRDNVILAHTFTGGVPVDLITANQRISGNEAQKQEIRSTAGDHYLDIALPVFDGKAGMLRLGISEEPYRKQVFRLWLQMSWLTLAILLLALTVTLFFIRKVTRPLAALSRATQAIDKGDLDVRVQAEGNDEVGMLAASFNHMVARLKDYTSRLEEQTMELERANHQTRTVCGIVQEIGALRSLNEIGSYLIKEFQHILKCNLMVLLILSESREILFALGERETKAIDQPDYPIYRSCSGRRVKTQVLRGTRIYASTRSCRFHNGSSPGRHTALS